MTSKSYRMPTDLGIWRHKTSGKIQIQMLLWATDRRYVVDLGTDIIILLKSGVNALSEVLIEKSDR